MTEFAFFSGIVTAISDFWTSAAGPDGCVKLVAVRDSNGNQANFVVEPDTYFINQAAIRPGDSVTGFYDANAPVPLIFPPQYRTLVMTRNSRNYHVKVANFNEELVSGDGTLKLNIGRSTGVFLTNGQPFTNSLANRDLAVVYGPTTRSIPAQTTPQQIIVLCHGWR